MSPAFPGATLSGLLPGRQVLGSLLFYSLSPGEVSLFAFYGPESQRRSIVRRHRADEQETANLGGMRSFSWKGRPWHPAMTGTQGHSGRRAHHPSSAIEAAPAGREQATEHEKLQEKRHRRTAHVDVGKTGAHAT